jgi:hypothetical protein
MLLVKKGKMMKFFDIFFIFHVGFYEKEKREESLIDRKISERILNYTIRMRLSFTFIAKFFQKKYITKLSSDSERNLQHFYIQNRNNL